MQLDFHYYGTYCAASLAGYPHADSLAVARSAQLVDEFSRSLLARIRGPLSAATTQMQLELMNASTDPVGLQDITRIWASFHFLPADLYAEVPAGGKRYRQVYRLICGPNGSLLADTLALAKTQGLEARGLAMHVLADTWAHRYFAGTPSLVINNTDQEFYEILSEKEDDPGRRVQFRHDPRQGDDPERGIYTSTIHQGNEHTIMNLGHGRAGHLPDYSYARYRYLPAWGGYREIVKDNPSDYWHAFCQMIYALQWCASSEEEFQLERYAVEEAAPYEKKIREILEKRQTDAAADWKELAEAISGSEIPDFSPDVGQEEYMNAGEKEREDTFLGRFILAALAQKSMVTNRIYTSGNMLAGYSVDYDKRGFRGIRDFRRLTEWRWGGKLR